MTKEKGFNKYVWLIMMILSLVFIVFTIFAMSGGGDKVLETALKDYAGSPLQVGDLDEEAHGFLSMSMLKPLWEEIWIGILGLFCALGLKQKKKYAWILGIFWSIMLLTNGAIQGGYELFILDWSSPCAQTLIFLVLGIIGLASLLVARKKGILLE
jgi:hypothetical protein